MIKKGLRYDETDHPETRGFQKIEILIIDRITGNWILKKDESSDFKIENKKV